MMAAAYLGLGSNLGNRYAYIQDAIDRINRVGLIKITGVSPIYISEPLEVDNHPDYLNCALRIETGLSPGELHRECRGIESQMGRKSKGDLQPRTIDIDLLLYENYSLQEPELTIPHQRIKQRAFVLKPLTDIDPGLRCPLTDESYLEILETKLKEQKIMIFDGKASKGTEGEN